MTGLIARMRAWLLQLFDRSAPRGSVVETLTFTNVVTWFQQPRVQACVDAHPDAVGFTLVRGPGHGATGGPSGVDVPQPRPGYPWVVVQGVFEPAGNHVVAGCARVVHARRLDEELRVAHQDTSLVVYR